MSFGDYNNYQSTDDADGVNNPFSQDNKNDFLRKSKQISKNIEKITKNTSEARYLVDAIGTSDDNQNVRSNWNKIRQETGILVQEAFALLRSLSSLPPAETQTDRKQRKIQKERLTDQLTQTLNAFQILQREAEKKEKTSYQRARTSFTSADNGSFGNQDSPQQQIQSLTDMEQDVDLLILDERSREIRQLEDDIGNINITFQELGKLVHDQGEGITSIEDMIDDAAIEVETGKVELEKAVGNMNKARKKKLFCAILLAIILTIIIIILIIAFHKKK